MRKRKQESSVFESLQLALKRKAQSTQQIKPLAADKTQKKEENGDQLESAGIETKSTVLEAQIEDLAECRQSGTTQDGKEFFWKGVSVSPDGLCALTNSEDHVARVFELPRLSAAALLCEEGNCIYDMAWYPKMDSSDPTSCCFAVSSQGRPVHLWDAYTGKVRASYSAINNKEELSTIISLAFNPHGGTFFGGVERGLYEFDLTRPGACLEFYPTTPTRLSRDGQRGILSTIDFNPNGSGMLAVGSYNGTLGLYADNDPGRLLTLINSHKQGVSLVKFSPCGNYLLAGGRKNSNSILCYDVRKFGEHVKSFPRLVSTHQRIQFDFTPSGEYILSGSCDGYVYLYKMHGEERQVEQTVVTSNLYNVVTGVSVVKSSRGDARERSFSFCACTGQRTFQSRADLSDSDDECTDVESVSCMKDPALLFKSFTLSSSTQIP